MVGGAKATERRVKNTAGREVVVKPNTAEARCRHRKVVQNAHSVQADTHDYFLPRPGRLSSKSGPTLAVSALRLGGMMFQRLCQNPHHIWCCARSGWWPWCSKKLHQNPHPGRLVFSLLRRWGGVPKVGVVFQKVVPESSVGWCSKSWGGVPKSCPRIPTARWGGVPKVGVVFQKVVPESPLCILLP